MLSKEEIENWEAVTATDLARFRKAQRALASEITSRVHGAEAGKAAEDVSNFLFAGGSPDVLTSAALEMLRQEIPNGTVTRGADGTVDILEMLTSTGLAASRGAGKRLVQQGGVSINGRRLGADEVTVPADSGYVLMKKGARDYALVRLN
jgi:tyrosyl-tRNA synthetase